MTTADVNGDGRPDLVVPNSSNGYSAPSGSVSVLLNQPNLLAPTLSGLSVPSGLPGTVLTLTGTGFGGATSVRFNGTAAPGFTVLSATTATATVPTGATSGEVILTTPQGTTNSQDFAVGPLSTPVAAMAAQVAAYPSPARGTLTVRRPAGPATTAVLVNALGQTVRTLVLPTAETMVDVAGLAAGVYALRLTVAGQMMTRRLVLD